MRLYMAGPLFTPYERSFIAENARRLRKLGFECFVPHEQEVVAATDRGSPTSDDRGRYQQQLLADHIFAKDNTGLIRANAVVALLDGPMVDDGTACEIGLFHGLMQSDPTKLGILGILTDTRASVGFEGKGLNLYLLGCIQQSGAVFSSVDDCVETLERWRAQLPAAGGGPTEMGAR